MTTYPTWREAHIAFNNNVFSYVTLELDCIFGYPVRFRMSRKRSRLFIMSAIVNNWPAPSLTQLDRGNQLYVKPL